LRSRRLISCADEAMLPWTEAALRMRPGDPMHEMARPMALPFTLDDLKVAERVRDELRRAVAAVVERGSTPHEKEPATGVLPANRLRLLFRGSPGTGKTMAAQALARELGVRLFRVDLSQVVSKYVGETEKALGRLFDAAEKAGAMLLFDEADALFGHRSEVKDSHDRYANIELDNLLRKMDRYDGVIALVTNRVCDLDAAFLRGLHVILDFPEPGPDPRSAI
jgi:SpoVK/Ycf46/Vps4 family AAA+-type ATPase